MCQTCRDNPEALHPLPVLILTEDEARRFAPYLEFTEEDIAAATEDPAGHIKGHYYLAP